MAKKKIEMTKEQIALYNELKKLSKTANQRILRIERNFGSDSWGIKKLRGKLESEPVRAWTISGRIKVSKQMSVEQLKSTIKATKSFLKAKSTSTTSGIKKTITTQKAELMRRADEGAVKKLTSEDYDLLYTLYDDTDFQAINKYLPSGTLMDILIESKKLNRSYGEFVEQLEIYMYTTPDSDIKGNIKRLYDKLGISTSKNVYGEFKVDNMTTQSDNSNKGNVYGNFNF